MKRIIQGANKRVSGEHVVLAFFIAISAFMFAESWSYSERARMFPQVTALATLVCSVALLLQRYLPEEVVGMVSATTVGRPDDEMVTEAVEGVERNIQDILVLALLIITYTVLAYLISFLYASPVFVLAYTIYNRKSWYKIVVLTILGYAIPYGFLLAIGGPIDSGVLI